MTNPREEWLADDFLPASALEGPVPWEDPNLPGAARFFRTLQGVLFHPSAFFRKLDPQGNWTDPFAFALIAGTGGMLFWLFWSILIWTPARETSGAALAWSPGPGPLLVLMAISPILVALGLGIVGLCLWGAVTAVGGSGGFIPAWRILCYAQGGMTLGIIPVFGLPLTAIWTLAILYHGINQVFGLSGGRTIGALVITIILKGVVWTFLLGSLVALVTLGGFLLLLQ